jgi:hypothetical protein
MSYVKIGSEQQSLDSASEQWISEQLRRRRADGSSTCVQVLLKTSSIDVVLSTPDCQRGTGGGRPPTQQEKEIFELWDKRGLNRPNYTVGDLIAFLKQVERSGIS